MMGGRTETTVSMSLSVLYLDKLKRIVPCALLYGTPIALRTCDGSRLPVVHAELDYRRPAKYDDLLEITAFVQNQKGVRLEIACEVRRKGEDGILVKGFTRHVCVSSSDFRPCPPPERFLEIINFR